MKNLLIFLFGVAFGVGGTMIWLHKDIKKQLEEMEQELKEKEEVPFTVGEGENKEKDPVPVAVRPETKVEYNKLIHENYVDPDETEDNSGIEFMADDEVNGGIIEIDDEEFMHNHEYSKDHLIYYRGDKIMCTEDGTKIEKPSMLVGGEWENCVGNHVNREAFIRNEKLATDYEIFVEEGLYVDDYGTD